jgi:putative transposase
MRRARVLQKGARYHVTARANRREMILDNDAIKELFVETIKRARVRYDFRVENFCVMGNHFHLIIQPGNDASLSRIMQWIMSVFAVAWNKIHHHTGHVWGERFFSRIIQTLSEYIRTFDYIIQNPVEAKQVDHPRQWRHGGLYHARSGRRDVIGHVESWITTLFPDYCQRLLV